jgi:CheY-like chemotaxis protein/two-component sensor histidine kinase
MVRLVDDLLDVSRLARGKISLQTEIIDIAQLLAQVCDDFRPLVEQSGLALNVSLPSKPVPVAGDPARLAQVLANVLQNAIKFTNAGGRVEVLLSGARDGQAALIEVRDTGIGMDGAMLGKAFEAFSQADLSLDRSRGGLGLGLALVKGLVELHEGSVRATSAGLDCGTTISIELPLAERSAMPPAETPEPESRGETQHRILIVEDNRDAANMLRMMLALQGNEVAVAYDGVDALRVAQEFAPSVVLCDIGLPGDFNGYAVADAFRQHARLSDAYLIAVTGYGRAEDRERSREAGFDAHLTKPVSLKDLTRVLNRQEVKIV